MTLLITDAASTRAVRRQRLRIRQAVLAITLGVLVSLMSSPTFAGATARSRLPSTFNTLAKSGRGDLPNHLAQVWRARTGNDGAFDRVIFDERFAFSAYTVRYATRVTADPSGLPVSMKGHYYLIVALRDATTAPRPRNPTSVKATLSPNLPEVVQIKKIGEFEDIVSFAVGLNRRRGFRVLQLKGPLRLVVDIAH